MAKQLFTASNESIGPLVLEGDILSLSASFYVVDNYLIDNDLGAHHRLSHFGELAITSLALQPTYGDWQNILKSVGIIDSEQEDLLKFLNDIGAIQINRSLRDRPKYLYQYLTRIIFGLKPSWTTYRNTASPVSIYRAVIRSSHLLIVAWLVLTLINVFSQADLTFFLALSVFTYITIVLSSLIHEIVHAIYVECSGHTPVIMSQGLRIGIVHKPLPYIYETASSLVGPAAGILIASIITLPIFTITHDRAILFTGLAVAVMHLLSLLPWFGDGASLMKLVWRRIYENS